MQKLDPDLKARPEFELSNFTSSFAPIPQWEGLNVLSAIN
jgi:hypothetical protein